LTGAAPAAPLARRADGLEISLDPARVDVARVFHWLSDESYWAAGRSRDVVERSITGSMVAGVYAGAAADAELVAFARVVTDGATFAWICDVFVGTHWRGRGIGGWLVETLVGELVEGRGILRLLLATRDAHAVYSKAGFEPLAGVWRWMEIDRRPGKNAILAMDPSKSGAAPDAPAEASA
jgi:GNAT superfamily N-acetyltransferase